MGNCSESVIDLSKDISHILGQGSMDGKGHGGGSFDTVGELPHRYGDGGHGGVRLLLAGKTSLVCGAKEEEVFSGVPPLVVQQEILGPVVIITGLPSVHPFPELDLLDLSLGHGGKGEGIAVAGSADGAAVAAGIVVIVGFDLVGEGGQRTSHIGTYLLVGQDGLSGDRIQ